MSETAKTDNRPAQVTVASWLIMVGSVFVVLMVWDRIAALHSLESRQALQDLLDQQAVKELGLDLGGLTTIVRTLSMVAAGCATAMAILGYQALQRSRPARFALTVLALPLFVTGLATGGFLSSAVAAAVATLWLRPSRVWFGDPGALRADRESGGRSTSESSAPTVPATQPAPHESSVSTTPPDPAAPAPPATSAYPRPASSPFGVPRSGAAHQAPYGQAAQAVQGRSGVRRGAATGRPTAAVWACLVTWVFSSIGALVVLGSIVLIASDSSRVLDAMHKQNPDLVRQGISDHVILTIYYVMCVVFVAWSVAAAVVAFFLFRGARWAWWALVVSTAGVTALCLLAVIGSLVMLVPLAGAAATISLLLRPEVRRWLA